MWQDGKKVEHIVKKITQQMSLAFHKKSYWICVEFSNYYFFFQRTKLRQPTGQRQLLENKKILRNISKIRHISNSFSHDMPATYIVYFHNFVDQNQNAKME